MSDPEFPDSGATGACTRNSDFQDVFAVNVDAVVRWNRWNGRWFGWDSLLGARFMPGSPIAAACRNDDVNEIWAVDLNEEMRGNHWNGKWNGWFSLPGAQFPPGAHVAAVAFNGEMRVAAVDVDGMPQEITWRGNWGTWESRPGVRATPGQPLALGTSELWLVTAHGELRRWRPKTRDWILEVGEKRFHPPVAAFGTTAVAFSTDDESGPGRLHAGTLDAKNPDGSRAWWFDE